MSSVNQENKENKFVMLCKGKSYEMVIIPNNITGISRYSISNKPQGNVLNIALKGGGVMVVHGNDLDNLYDELKECINYKQPAERSYGRYR